MGLFLIAVLVCPCRCILFICAYFSIYFICAMLLLTEGIRCLFNANFQGRFLWAIFITACNSITLPVLITRSNSLYKTAKCICLDACLIYGYISYRNVVWDVIFQVALCYLCTCTDFAYCCHPVATKMESRQGFAIQKSVNL